MQHDLTKQKIIELVPGMKLKGCTKHWKELPQDGCFTCEGTIYETITLAHVLRAIDSDEWGFPVVSNNGVFFKLDSETGEAQEMGDGVQWNLTTDYDGQSDEVKTFIGSLLDI